jgi:hypothetical protein
VYQQERPIHGREDSRPKRRTVPGYRKGFVPIPRISASEAFQRSASPNEDYDDRTISFPSGPAHHAAASRASTRRKLVAAPLAGSCCESAQQFRVTSSALAEPAQGFQSLRRSSGPDQPLAVIRAFRAHCQVQTHALRQYATMPNARCACSNTSRQWGRLEPSAADEVAAVPLSVVPVPEGEVFNRS